MTLERPPVEHYVRVSVEAHGCTIEPAVEHRDGDDFAEVTAKLEAIAHGVARGSMRAFTIGPSDSMALAKAAAETIRLAWPERAYFVEIWQTTSRGWAQVFQPFGVPRNR